MRRTAVTRIGIDIDAAAVRLLGLCPVDAGGWRIETALEEPLPPGAVAAGSVRHAMAVGEAIRRLAQQAGCRRGQRAVAAVSSMEVMFGWCRTSASLAGTALDIWMHAEVERRFPYPLAELGFDFMTLNKPGLATEPQSWLLVAAHSEHIAARMAALSLAGLTVAMLDATPLALARAVVCAANLPLLCGVMLEVGVEGLSLAWLRQGKLHHFEVWPMSLQTPLLQLVEAIQERITRADPPLHNLAGISLLLLGAGAARDGLEAALSQRLGGSIVMSFRLERPMSGAASSVIEAQPAAWALAYGLACKDPIG